MVLSLEKQADIILKELGDTIRDATDQIAISFGTNVVPRTPVRTGHARRNWQLSIGAPNEQELPGVDFAGNSTVVNIVSRVRASRSRNPFVPLIVENNVPYILRLNEGYSRQAPPMFVQNAIALAVRSVRV